MWEWIGVCACCEREEQTGEAMFNGWFGERDCEKWLQPVGIPAFIFMIAWSSELMLVTTWMREMQKVSFDMSTSRVLQRRNRL
jgi:hypothetical protein